MNSGDPTSELDKVVSGDSANFGEQWDWLRRMERGVLMPLCRVADTGILGLTPLRLHILICGFPRSGTTMLQMMLENGLPNARRFGREVGGWRAATYSLRNHAIVVSKVPQDVFRLNPLRRFYAGRKAELRIILMVRDPRDVLTSRRKNGGPAGYVVSSARWQRYYDAFCASREAADAVVVRYEDLVKDVAGQQARIERFTGEKMAVPFEQFHTVERPDFDLQTLNGLRPVESSLLRRWAEAEHRARIEQVLRELPLLPGALIDLGYERDDAWADAYRSGFAAPAGAASSR
jgi:Sulfotransferase domain